MSTCSIVPLHYSPSQETFIRASNDANKLFFFFSKSSKMVMILDAFMSRYCTLLADYVQEEVTMLLGVKEELQKLLQRMESIQSLLQDAEKKKFDEKSTELWLSQLKDAMYEADDIIDLCRIEGAKLLADQNPKSDNSPVCRNLFYCCFTRIPLRHEIGSRIKKLNNGLDLIYENRKQYKLEILLTPEQTRITLVDSRQTDPIEDDMVVGTEVEDAANELVHRLVFENVQVKCLIVAIVGMGGIGKTTLAQKIFNHENIKKYFNLKVWVCISQTYSEIELLQQIITKAGVSYGNAKSKADLLPLLSDSIASVHSLFIVLDDVWRADVWVALLRKPLKKSNTAIRILITTRDENLANDIEFAYIHRVEPLSLGSSWDMLRKLAFHNGEEEQETELKELGFEIVKKCGHLPLAIKTITVVLRKDRTRKAWEDILTNEGWSISKLPEELRGALYLSFEDLPSHIKQCFLYLSLYPEICYLRRCELTQLWVAEGFIKEQETNLLLEDVAEKYFVELVKRNLLQPSDDEPKMHDVVRYLALFLSAEESSYGNENLRINKNSATYTKLRRLSVVNNHHSATQILDSIVDLGPLRTLLASSSRLMLDDERLKRLSHLHVLDISRTGIKILPDSIGSLVHLRYLDLSYTDITTIPKTIQHLAYLQFLKIQNCGDLTQLPGEIIRLDKLRCLNLIGTPLRFIPKGIYKLTQLNELDGFVVSNNDSSSQLKDLKSLKQIRKLEIEIQSLQEAESGAKFFIELSNLSKLALVFTIAQNFNENTEEQLKVEKLFDELMPPTKLEELSIVGFFGRRFPNWMASTLERCVLHLTKLSLENISSCNQLPPLGQLLELKTLIIRRVSKVKKIGPEFICGVNSGINSSTRIAFPKLEKLYIGHMLELEEWSFCAPMDENASPSLKLLPSLQELQIDVCPLLKQLPKGLKHSAIKSLFIGISDTLKSLDDLPTKTKKLNIGRCKNLEKICCLPELKHLRIEYCKALSCVEKPDSLESLVFEDVYGESLPEWLLKLLQQNDSNKSFQLELVCSKKVLQECVQGGSYWGLIQCISRVDAESHPSGYLRYRKQPYLYETDLLHYRKQPYLYDTIQISD